jgi:hypothetical protein
VPASPPTGTARVSHHTNIVDRDLKTNIYILALKLSQGIEKPDPATVFGEAEFTLVDHEYLDVKVAEGTVEVQKAIA